MSAEAVKPKAAEPAATTWVGDDGVTKEELEGLDLAKFPWLGKSLRSTLELAKNPLRRLLSDKIMTLATRNVKLEPMDDSNAAFPKLLEEVKKVAKERNQELTDKEAMDAIGGKAPVVRRALLYMQTTSVEQCGHRDTREQWTHRLAEMWHVFSCVQRHSPCSSPRTLHAFHTPMSAPWRLGMRRAENGRQGT